MFHCLSAAILGFKRPAKYPLSLLAQASYIRQNPPNLNSDTDKIRIPYNGSVCHLRRMGYRLESETPLADVVYSIATHAKNLRVTEYKYCVIERIHDDFIVFENEGTNDSRTLCIDTVQLRKESAFAESLSSAGILVQ